MYATSRLARLKQTGRIEVNRIRDVRNVSILFSVQIESMGVFANALTRNVITGGMTLSG